jgi:hypothetical protein
MVGDFGNQRDIGAGTLQDRAVDALHIVGDQRGERRDTGLLELLVESKDDAHVNSFRANNDRTRIAAENRGLASAGFQASRESSALSWARTRASQ